MVFFCTPGLFIYHRVNTVPVMSLLKIPFSLSIVWAVHATMTAPQPTPELKERVGSIGPEVLVMPFFLKVGICQFRFRED